MLSMSDKTYVLYDLCVIVFMFQRACVQQVLCAIGSESNRLYMPYALCA